MHYWNQCVKHVSSWQAGACCSLLPCDDWPVSLVRILAQLNHEQECEISCVHRWHAFCHHSLLVRHTNTLGWLVTDYMLMGGFNQIKKSKLAAQVRFWGEKHITTWMKIYLIKYLFFRCQQLIFLKDVNGVKWVSQGQTMAPKTGQWRSLGGRGLDGVWAGWNTFSSDFQVPPKNSLSRNKIRAVVCSCDLSRLVYNWL